MTRRNCRRRVEPAERVDPDAANDAEPADATETCPSCGADDCEKLFHVHLRAPRR